MKFPIIHLIIYKSALTGEIFQLKKIHGDFAKTYNAYKVTNCLFIGIQIINRNDKTLIVDIGIETYFGKILNKLKLFLY